MPCTQEGPGSTPRANDIGEEHLNIFAFPVLVLVFLVKPVFELIEREVVITRMTTWQMPVNISLSCQWFEYVQLVASFNPKIAEKASSNRCEFDLFLLKPNVMLLMSRSGTSDVILESLDIYARPTTQHAKSNKIMIIKTLGQRCEACGPIYRLARTCAR